MSKNQMFAFLCVSVWSPPYPNLPKFGPHLHRYNSLRVHPYVHPQHMKVLKHFLSPCWSNSKVPIVTLLGWYLGLHKRSLNQPNQEKLGNISVRLVPSCNLVPPFS
jgi:hypothetical protein